MTLPRVRIEKREAEPPDGYEVGFGKPPRHSQFKPGQSGNPSGRPKGAKSFETELEDVLKQQTAVTSGGQTRYVSTVKAVLLRLRHKALSGELPAIDRFLGLMANRKGDNESNTPTPEEDAEIVDMFLDRVLRGGTAKTKAQSRR